MSGRERLRVGARGAVQGVGFRPFVYRLALDLGLDGFVTNTPQGVLIEVEGPRESLDAFRRRLSQERPPRAVVQSLEASWLDAIGYEGFSIRESVTGGDTSTLVMPDIATCFDCRRELLDPSDRRYRYPFINCTNCGPRFSIIEGLPYDRVSTSMRAFPMCPACEREYHDPRSRRFHAQPNACHACGPQLALRDPEGAVQSMRDTALTDALAAIRSGLIVAVKGLGGFHLMVDATSQAAVERLRERKHREEKPFAVMYRDLAAAADDCDISDEEARLLLSPESPIVLVRRRHAARNGLASLVAPGNPNLGVLLPYTPLHMLIASALDGPVIATSGNLSDEPICTDETDALERLRGIADLFLVHNRPIVRHVDDSIVRVLLGRELVLRRARGYAPMPIAIDPPSPPTLAVGAHLKNTIGLAAGPDVFLSQHIGDLESTQATDAFLGVIGSLKSLLRIAPERVVADLHPDYLSTRYAQTMGLPVIHVQHHFAHIAACMAENDLRGTALGVAWDGTGFGIDGTIWGGEFLSVAGESFTRVACLRPFRLPGGERAVREPRRTMLGLLAAMGMDWGEVRDLPAARSCTDEEHRVVQRALDQRINAPVTTSAGRLFDGVAAIMGLRGTCSFEGQAAMEVEHAVDPAARGGYPFLIAPEPPRFAMDNWQAPPIVIDWEPALRALIEDVRCGLPLGTIAGRFHNTLAEIIVAVAEIVEQPRVVLSGGCFQNRWLTERAVARLRDAGFRPYWHQRIPPNDGGVALGQIVAATPGRGAVSDRGEEHEGHAGTAHAR